MGKYTTSTRPKALKPTKVNDMGSLAYELNPKEELVATVLTTFVQKSYYETENEILKRIQSRVKDVDPLFAAKTAIYTRREANMRSSSHVIAGELTKYVSGKPWAARFYERIIVRPDDMAEILAYYLTVVRKGKGKMKIPNSMKKGFKAKLEKLDPYQIDKYKMLGRTPSLIDLVNLFHPKPTQVNKEAYKRLIAGESLDGLYTTKILEKEKSKAGQSGDKEAVKEAITDTLVSNDMDNPVMNILRNLKSIIESSPEQVDLACKILIAPGKISNSRLLPFRFAAAYTEVEKLAKLPSGSVVKFEKGTDKASLVNKVLDALEQAINISCMNIPKLPGTTAILIDHSGSVRGDAGGSSKVSAFSKVTTAMIGNLFGSMLMQSQDNVFMGLFGDRLIRYDKIDRSKGILATAQDTYKLGASCGGGTEAGIYEFFEDVVKHNIPVNNIIIFSDQVIGDRNNWYGRTSSTGSGRFNDLFKKFRAQNPRATVLSVDIRQTKGTTVFNKQLGVTQVAGWSEKIFDVLGAESKGYAEIIKKIEAIEI